MIDLFVHSNAKSSTMLDLMLDQRESDGQRKETGYHDMRPLTILVKTPLGIKVLNGSTTISQTVSILAQDWLKQATPISLARKFITLKERLLQALDWTGK
jgi:hypothetical protein